MRRAFTLIELLVVIAILGLLSSIVLSSVNSARTKAYKSRSLNEFKNIETALMMYQIDNGSFPPDASRDMPSGLETYISGGVWPKAPYPGSVYDWDSWTISGQPVNQISIRFCTDADNINTCIFPKETWADNFDGYSAMYYCISGSCRSHSSKPENHPGYCVNCN